MRRPRQTVTIERTGDGRVGISYYDDPRRASYLRWEMPINEAESLAKWWAAEGSQIRKKQLPVRDAKFGSVRISMFTCSGSVNVKGLTTQGNAKMLGYSLPGPVVKKLSAWLEKKQNVDAETTDRKAAHV